MLDSLPPFVRHLILMLVAAGLSWAGTDLIPWLNGQPGWGALAGTLAAALLAYVLPITNQYGLGDGTGGVNTGSAK